MQYENLPAQLDLLESIRQGLEQELEQAEALNADLRQINAELMAENKLLTADLAACRVLLGLIEPTE